MRRNVKNRWTHVVHFQMQICLVIWTCVKWPTCRLCFLWQF